MTGSPFVEDQRFGYSHDRGDWSGGMALTYILPQNIDPREGFDGANDIDMLDFGPL